jgi:hypothetical protein
MLRSGAQAATSIILILTKYKMQEVLPLRNPGRQHQCLVFIARSNRENCTFNVDDLPLRTLRLWVVPAGVVTKAPETCAA